MGGGGESQTEYPQVNCGNPPFHVTINSVDVQERIHFHFSLTLHLWAGPKWVRWMGNEPRVRNIDEESQEGKEIPTVSTQVEIRLA